MSSAEDQTTFIRSGDIRYEIPKTVWMEICSAVIKSRAELGVVAPASEAVAEIDRRCIKLVEEGFIDVG